MAFHQGFTFEDFLHECAVADGSEDEAWGDMLDSPPRDLDASPSPDRASVSPGCVTPSAASSGYRARDAAWSKDVVGSFSASGSRASTPTTAAHPSAEAAATRPPGIDAVAFDVAPPVKFNTRTRAEKYRQLHAKLSSPDRHGSAAGQPQADASATPAEDKQAAAERRRAAAEDERAARLARQALRLQDAATRREQERTAAKKAMDDRLAAAEQRKDKMRADQRQRFAAANARARDVELLQEMEVETRRAEMQARLETGAARASAALQQKQAKAQAAGMDAALRVASTRSTAAWAARQKGHALQRKLEAGAQRREQSLAARAKKDEAGLHASPPHEPAKKTWGVDGQGQLARYRAPGVSYAAALRPGVAQQGRSTASTPEAAGRAEQHDEVDAGMALPPAPSRQTGAIARPPVAAASADAVQAPLLEEPCRHRCASPVSPGRPSAAAASPAHASPSGMADPAEPSVPWWRTYRIRAAAVLPSAADDEVAAAESAARKRARAGRKLRASFAQAVAADTPAREAGPAVPAAHGPDHTAWQMLQRAVQEAGRLLSKARDGDTWLWARLGSTQSLQRALAKIVTLMDPSHGTLLTPALPEGKLRAMFALRELLQREEGELPAADGLAAAAQSGEGNDPTDGSSASTVPVRLTEAAASLCLREGVAAGCLAIIAAEPSNDGTAPSVPPELIQQAARVLQVCGASTQFLRELLRSGDICAVVQGLCVNLEQVPVWELGLLAHQRARALAHQSSASTPRVNSDSAHSPPSSPARVRMAAALKSTAPTPPQPLDRAADAALCLHTVLALLELLWRALRFVTSAVQATPAHATAEEKQAIARLAASAAITVRYMLNESAVHRLGLLLALLSSSPTLVALSPLVRMTLACLSATVAVPACVSGQAGAEVLPASVQAVAAAASDALWETMAHLHFFDLPALLLQVFVAVAPATRSSSRGKAAPSGGRRPGSGSTANLSHLLPQGALTTAILALKALNHILALQPARAAQALAARDVGISAQELRAVCEYVLAHASVVQQHGVAARSPGSAAARQLHNMSREAVCEVLHVASALAQTGQPGLEALRAGSSHPLLLRIAALPAEFWVLPALAPRLWGALVPCSLDPACHALLAGEAPAVLAHLQSVAKLQVEPVAPVHLTWSQALYCSGVGACAGLVQDPVSAVMGQARHQPTVTPEMLAGLVAGQYVSS